MQLQNPAKYWNTGRPFSYLQSVKTNSFFSLKMEDMSNRKYTDFSIYKTRGDFLSLSETLRKIIKQLEVTIRNIFNDPNISNSANILCSRRGTDGQNLNYLRETF